MLAKYLNETLLVCGLCLLLSNCFDNILKKDAMDVDVTTDAAFLDFMDE